MIKPKTRKEVFMDAIAKGKKPTIAPLTREEVLMAEHAERESSGGGGGGSFTLSPATKTRLGGVKVGEGLSVTEDGTLSVDQGEYAKKEELPKKPGDINAQPAGDYALRSEIPTVPVQSVNGKTGAVSLSANDVNARPDNWMPTAQEVGALPSTYTPPDQTAEQVGADPKGTAASAVGSHNTNTAAHNDIRLELKAINDRLTAFFDSDNQTLDELSEIVAYITNNKSLIDSITTSKVSVADIINNLTTNVSNKPLSAAQGVALKALIDAIIIPAKLSQLANDVGYITGYTETDPTVPSWAKTASKPSYNKSEVGLGNVDNVKQYSASNPPPYPVTSVNGQTGAVVIPISTVPTKVSAFTNDAGYLTEISKEEIVQQVIAALGTPVFGTIDANNNITLTGNLADGTYTVKYEDADGNVTEIGEINVGGPTVFDVPITWIIGTKLNKSNGAVESTTAAEYNASDYIQLVAGASYVLATENDCYNSMNVIYYNDNNTFVGYQADLWTSNQTEMANGKPRSAALVIPSGATKIRLRQYEAAVERGWTHDFITLTGTM